MRPCKNAWSRHSSGKAVSGCRAVACSSSHGLRLGGCSAMWARRVVRARRNHRPALGQIHGLAHERQEPGFVVVVRPAPRLVQLDEVRAPQVDEIAPLLRCLGEPACGLPFWHAGNRCLGSNQPPNGPPTWIPAQPKTAAVGVCSPDFTDDRWLLKSVPRRRWPKRTDPPGGGGRAGPLERGQGGGGPGGPHVSAPGDRGGAAPIGVLN